VISGRRGNPRNGLRAPMELRAMQAQRPGGAIDPPPVDQTLKLRKVVQLQLALTSTSLIDVTSGNIATFTPGVAGLSAMRMLKISIWGPVQSNLTTTGDATGWVAVQAPGDTAFLDSASTTFEDKARGMTYPPALHITPAFVQRERWVPCNTSDATVLFRVAGPGGAAALAYPVIIHVTLELASANTTPAFMNRRLVLPPPDITSEQEFPPLN